MNGAHQLTFPVNEGLPTSEPVVDIHENVAVGVTVMEEVSYEEFTEDDIKS